MHFSKQNIFSDLYMIFMRDKYDLYESLEGFLDESDSMVYDSLEADQCSFGLKLYKHIVVSKYLL